MRISFLGRHPVCNLCRRAPASILDHIKPHRGDADLFWNQSNWQSLCIRFKGIKTAEETLHPRRALEI